MCIRDRDVEDPKGPQKGPPEGSYRENTYPMLVLPLRKIFVPSLVEIGPVAVSYTHLDVYKRQI